MYGLMLFNKSWYDSAIYYFNNAISLDPSNDFIKESYANLMSRHKHYCDDYYHGGYRRRNRGCSCCCCDDCCCDFDISCCDLICLDQCCECMGEILLNAYKNAASKSWQHFLFLDTYMLSLCKISGKLIASSA